MSKIIDNIKSGNYEVVDNQGVSVTGHFTQCLEKEFADLEAKLAESEEKVKHWHNLYNGRDEQFQSVRQRYHLLNKLQSNYDKKDKLHLAYMQCAELVNENEKLKQQLHDLPKKIMEEIKGKQPNFTENSYGFTTKQGWDICVEILDTILKKFGGEDD